MFKCRDKVIYRRQKGEIRGICYGNSQNMNAGRTYDIMMERGGFIEGVPEKDIELDERPLSSTVSLVVCK